MRKETNKRFESSIKLSKKPSEQSTRNIKLSPLQKSSFVFPAISTKTSPMRPSPTLHNAVNRKIALLASASKQNPQIFQSTTPTRDNAKRPLSRFVSPRIRPSLGADDELQKAFNEYSGESVETGDGRLSKNCIYHSSRRSQFAADVQGERARAGLCASCAVTLAARGGRLVELGGGERRDCLQSFLDELAETKTRYLDEKATIEERKSAFYRVAERELSLFEQSVAEMIAALEECKAKARNEFRKRCEAFKATFNALNGELKSNIDGVALIQSDIRQNFEAIVEKIEESAFQSIFTGLKAKNDVYNEYIRVFNGERISRGDFEFAFLAKLNDGIERVYKIFAEFASENGEFFKGKTRGAEMQFGDRLSLSNSQI